MTNRAAMPTRFWHVVNASTNKCHRA